MPLNDFSIKISSSFIKEKLNICRREVDEYNRSRVNNPLGLDNIHNPNFVRIAGLVFFPNETAWDIPTDSGLYFVIAVWKNASIYLWSEHGPELDRHRVREKKVYCSNDGTNILVEWFHSQNTLADNTEGIDQVFISIEQLCYTSGLWFGDEHNRMNVTYLTNTLFDFQHASDTDIFFFYPEAHKYYLASNMPPPDETLMKCQVTLAFIVIDSFMQTHDQDGHTSVVPSDLHHYRTLKFNPFPEPLLTDGDDRPAIAYELGTPCPPMWRSQFIGISGGTPLPAYSELPHQPYYYDPRFPGPNPFFSNFFKNPLSIPFVISTAIALIETVVLIARVVK